MTLRTIRVDGLVIRTAWDDDFVGPVEVLITIDHRAIRPAGKGISDRALRALSLQSMAPESGPTLGDLRYVKDWLAANKPALRKRPQDPEEFYAHVALFFVLALRDGERSVVRVLANYAAVRPYRAREWIETARRLGMLTGTPAGTQAGRACGNLTDKARATLASREVDNPEIAA